MNTNEKIRAVLFYALLFVVAIEFMLVIGMNMITLSIEAIIATTTIITNLGLIDKTLLIALLGTLTFMKDSER